MFKLHYLRKASAAGLSGLLATTAYAALKEASSSNLTPWKSHTITILFCGTVVFFLTAIFLRREQAKLQASISFSDSLMESLPGVVCVFDPLGNVRRWNTNFLGYSAAEISSTGIMGTVASESLAMVKQTMEIARDHGAAETEAYLVAKSGAKISCYLTEMRITFEGQPCILGVAIDISKRKRAEERILLQSTALESAANAIVITDANLGLGDRQLFSGTRVSWV